MVAAHSSDKKSVHIFGIRHHGPGSSRSLLAALEALQPDALLIEGPPEGDQVLPFVMNEAMQPPVALLVYVPGQASCAAYYPFANYSPEWQAMRYGASHGIQVQFMDLPASNQLALMTADHPDSPPPAETVSLPEETAEADVSGADSPETTNERYLTDPLKALAEAAGYRESEQWWEHMVEERSSSQDLFAAILEAMSALREAVPQQNDALTIRREAAMRQAIRTVLAEGFQRVAVVCGAWHGPALVDRSDELGDAVLLRGLPKFPVQATWVPWTAARLTRASGYGAGIDAPGWYQHLWHTNKEIVTRWMIKVARLLRDEGVDVSPAHTIEAVRLAEALAALRERPLPGLTELNEAALTVYCFGNPVPMRLIEERLMIGSEIGSVPPETPMAPLQADFEREARRLRLPREGYEKLLDLDLRKTNDLERSHLLHRLNLIGVPWGQNNDASVQANARGRGGTFHEIWCLKWQPEYSILLIEGGQWGNSIAAAASAKVRHEADKAPDLVSLTRLVEDVLLADLPEAIQRVMTNLQAQASVSSDTQHLMQALPPLASVLRYGNVRQTDTAMIAKVIDGLVTRICIGLAGACAALNEDAAEDMFKMISQVDEAILRLNDAGYRQSWQQALTGIAGQESIHGLVAGRACRILLDQAVIETGEANRRLGLTLSTASEATQAAAWLEGFLRGSGQLLVHDHTLLEIVDDWLASLNGDTFQQLLPLLRRTFANFTHPERRMIGEQLQRPNSAAHAAGRSKLTDFNEQRAERVLPLAARLLGLPSKKESQS